MKEKEFQQNIENVIEVGNQQEGRLLEDLDLQLAGCHLPQKEVEQGSAMVGTTISYTYQAKERHLNPRGGIHGGIVCSLFDTALGMGAVALTECDVATSDISVSYLRQMMGGGARLVVEYSHVGSKIVNGTGKIYDSESGELCATCMATYILLQGKKFANA